MINQLEVPMFLEEAVPNIKSDICDGHCNRAYDLMSSLSAYTCQNITAHDFKTVKRCFQVAEKLYDKGNAVVKNAVQNVFVYSFTNIFQKYPVERQRLMAIMPISLYSLYIAQINHCGC